MKQVLPTLAKRLLAFTLALVLLLALVPALPLTANAAVETEGWEYNTKFKSYYKRAEFISADEDLVFEDDQPYDWEVRFKHSYTAGKITATLTAKVFDESGNQIGDTAAPESKWLQPNEEYVILTASDFPALTIDLYGEFTVVMEMYNGSTFMAKLTKTFSRVNTNPFTATVTSRSNPDMVFTFADPIDLVLNIKKNDGVAAACSAAVTVTNASGTKLLAAEGIYLPVSTNITLSVKDTVNLPEITAAGAYKVNVTLTDASGNIQLQESFDFSVAGLVGSVEASITSASGNNPTFGSGVIPDMTLNLQKTDGVAESLIASITVTQSGSTSFTEKVTLDVPASGTCTYKSSKLSSLPANGNFLMTVVLTDDAGNARGSVSAAFSRTDTTPMSCRLTNNNSDNTGKIYTADDDFSLTLGITHTASANKVVTIKATGTLNGKPFEKSMKKSIPSTGKLNVTIEGSNLGSYGIFEDLTFSIYASDGSELWSTSNTYDFSRVLTTSDPGDLPLLNVNVHYTNMDVDTMKEQVKLTAQAGTKMWRSSITWEVVETSKGVYKMPSQLTSVMDQTKTNGMQALIILAYNNSLYGNADPDVDTWVAAYAEYCYQVALYMAKNYRDQVVAFEIWNEWNNSSMSKVPDANDRVGDKYAKVVIAASKKIRQVNKKYGTNFLVIGGATSGDGSQTNTKTGEFIQAMLATPGFLEAIDGISFHTYSNIETGRTGSERYFKYVSPAEYDFISRLNIFKSYLEEANTPDDLQIWITETGWSTNADPEIKPAEYTTDGRTHITYGATEEGAAAYLVQLYSWALAEGSIDHIFWYDLLNDCRKNDAGQWEWRTDGGEYNYGLLHSWRTDVDTPGAYYAKQGYVTMCALSSMLGGATNGEAVALGDGVQAYSFTVNGKTMVVAWTTSDTTKTLNCSGSMTVTDMYGNANSNLTSATLSQCPIYIVYSGTLTVG